MRNLSGRARGKRRRGGGILELKVAVFHQRSRGGVVQALANEPIIEDLQGGKEVGREGKKKLRPSLNRRWGKTGVPWGESYIFLRAYILLGGRGVKLSG